MIKFRPQRVDRRNNNTPIISDREIDVFAEAVLRDYRPELLRAPGIINVEHFLETYLNARLEYCDLYCDDPSRRTLGLTAFRDCAVKVFNREEESVSKVFVPERTVMLDNYLTEPNKEQLCLFSGLHEGGHILIHWNVFNGGGDDEFEEDEYYEPLEPVVYCRRDTIENFGGTGKKERTAAEWREHHADYFAAATAMPLATFKPFVTRALRENGVYKGAITLGRDDDLDILANDLIPESISEAYGVSKRAARIRLKKAGFVIGIARSY